MKRCSKCNEKIKGLGYSLPDGLYCRECLDAGTVYEEVK